MHKISEKQSAYGADYMLTEISLQPSFSQETARSSNLWFQKDTFPPFWPSPVSNSTNSQGLTRVMLCSVT